MKMVVIDGDYTYNKAGEPTIRLYGKDISNGKDVVLHVRGFEPYIYLDTCGLDHATMKNLVEKELKGYVKRIEIVKRFKPIGYQSKKVDMLKLTLFNPKVTPDVRKSLEENIEEITESSIYEADIPFINRCMSDHKVGGMSVIEFLSEKLKNYGLNCDNLFICNKEDIKVTNEIVNFDYTEHDKSSIFLKVGSFDIEVLTVESRMPDFNIDPVLLVSFHFNYDVLIEGISTRNVILLLHKTDNKFEVINGRPTYIFNDETKIINKTFEFIKSNDVTIGYNINGFDIPYLIDRFRALGTYKINIGNGDKTLYYRSHLSKGIKVTKISGFSGKIIFDVLPLVKRDDESNPFKKEYKLKNHKLETVAKNVLGKEKLQFSIAEMQKYWNNCDDIELRNRFIDYCSRDSELVLDLFSKFRLLDKFVMMSRRSGKITQDIINSMGSGLMVENLLLESCGNEDRVVPCRKHENKKDVVKKDDEKDLEGAFVLEPKLGVTDNVAVCDYLSLYPTTMIRHNICFSTLVTDPDELEMLKKEDKVTEFKFHESGVTYGWFVKKEVYKGIIPRQLEKLLGERAALKAEMKKFDKNSTDYIMLNASQNAVKILLNSHYGYTGDKSAKLYNWNVASAVTDNGQKQIKATIKMINSNVILRDNYKYVLEVIQGDTDSTYVWVRKFDSNGTEISKLTREEVVFCVQSAADDVNKTLEKPMKLAFENYIRRLISVAKKHYGMLTIDDNGRKSIVTKGLESVRRDWSDFTTETVESIIKNILESEDIKDSIDYSVDLIKNQSKKLKGGGIDINKLILTNKLEKPIKYYKSDEPHVSVVIKMKARGREPQIGDRIAFIITNNGKEKVSDRAEEAEYVINNNLPVDYDYYVYNQLVVPSMRMLSLLGIREEILLLALNEKQRDLTNW